MMEEHISGFKTGDDWGTVVEHGERISQVLQELGVESGSEYRDRFADDFEEWNEWRPKAHESFERDVKPKAAEQASVSEGEGERIGAEPDEDLHASDEKLSASYAALEDRDVESGGETGTQAVDRAARAADTASRKALRTVEEGVYRHVMTQLAPCYFDNELVSANVERPIHDGDDEFSFEVNINDDHLKADVSTVLSRYEDESIAGTSISRKRRSPSRRSKASRCRRSSKTSSARRRRDRTSRRIRSNYRFVLHFVDRRQPWYSVAAANPSAPTT